jgi:hypothetical protein
MLLGGEAARVHPDRLALRLALPATQVAFRF